MQAVCFLTATRVCSRRASFGRHAALLVASCSLIAVVLASDVWGQAPSRLRRPDALRSPGTSTARVIPNSSDGMMRAASATEVIEEEIVESPVMRSVGTRTASRTMIGEPIGSSVRSQFAGSRNYVPRHEQMGTRRMATQMVGEPEVIGRGIPAAPPQGEIQFEHSPMHEEGVYATEGSCHGDCGHCGSCANCCLIPCPTFCWDNFQIFGGVQGFTGPPNRGSTGSFGFHEGANLAGPLPCFGFGQIGWQVGTRLTHSNFAGAEFTPDNRNQVFVTAGLFRRVDWGWQWGVVYDWLHDNWYYTATVGQLRGELSWMFPCRHEFGFWFATSAKTDQVVATVRNANNANVNEATNWVSTDLYAFFYRRRFGDCDQGNARLYAGFTGESDGLIGADALVPICNNFAFQAGFSYLVPEESVGRANNLNAAHAQEGWNLAMSVIWYPGCGQSNKSYYRPLLSVADNGVFMMDRK